MELILLLIEGFNDRLKGFVIKSVAWPRVKTCCFIRQLCQGCEEVLPICSAINMSVTHGYRHSENACGIVLKQFCGAFQLFEQFVCATFVI